MSVSAINKQEVLYVSCSHVHDYEEYNLLDGNHYEACSLLEANHYEEYNLFGGNHYEEYSLLGGDAVKLDISLQIFRWNILPPSSVSKNMLGRYLEKRKVQKTLQIEIECHRSFDGLIR
jgi:hypothetical protein